MVKDLIFISHSSPKENYFASWLASKLKLLGYNVWVDVDDLRSGSAFWPEIQKKIKFETKRFIAIVSKSYIEKSYDSKSGIFKELEIASHVTDEGNFIIPIKYDESSHADFPAHTQGFDAINEFYTSWYNGFIELNKLLEELNIPKQKKDNVLSFWHESLKIKTNLLKREEQYKSNWFPIKLPNAIFIHEPELFSEEIIKQKLKYPYVEYAKRIITFASSKTFGKEIRLASSRQIDLNYFIADSTYIVDKNLTIFFPEHKVIQLLHNVIYDYLDRSTALVKFAPSKKKNVIYYAPKTFFKKLITLKEIGKRGRFVVAPEDDIVWHMALSVKADLSPFPRFTVKNSLIFTDIEEKVIEDKDVRHTLRRSVCNDWFNRDWLERMLCMVKIIGDSSTDEQYIEIPVDENIFLLLSRLPFELTADTGYTEP